MTQAKEDLWQELQNLRGWYDSLQREKEQLDSQLNLSESILSQRNVQDADKSSVHRSPSMHPLQSENLYTI